MIPTLKAGDIINIRCLDSQLMSSTGENKFYTPIPTVNKHPHATLAVGVCGSSRADRVYASNVYVHAAQKFLCRKEIGVKKAEACTKFGVDYQVVYDGAIDELVTFIKVLFGTLVINVCHHTQNPGELCCYTVFPINFLAEKFDQTFINTLAKIMQIPIVEVTPHQKTGATNWMDLSPEEFALAFYSITDLWRQYPVHRGIPLPIINKYKLTIKQQASLNHIIGATHSRTIPMKHWCGEGFRTIGHKLFIGRNNLRKALVEMISASIHQYQKVQKTNLYSSHRTTQTSYTGLYPYCYDSYFTDEAPIEYLPVRKMVMENIPLLTAFNFKPTTMYLLGQEVKRGKKNVSRKGEAVVD